MSNALSHAEKVVLAYSRTVSGTLSIISSILILNKIYRCCYKKRCISLNNPNNNNNAAFAVPATSPQQQQPQTSTVPELRTNPSGRSTTAATTTNISISTTLPVLYEEEAPPPPHIIVPDDSNSHNMDEILVDDDGYTPLPLLQQQQHPNIVSIRTVTAEPERNTNPVTTSAAATPSTNTTTAIAADTTTTTIVAATTNTPPQSTLSSLVSLLSYTTVYQRLLIGTSVIDLFHSFWAALSTLPVPASSGVVYGHGTVTTCSMQGFFVQFSAATPIYFAALTFYFMSKVCYHTTDAALSQRYEIYFHLLPVIVAFGGGIIGVSLKVFNPIALPELGCWVAPYPRGCARTQTCTRGYKIGEYSDWYAWCFAFIWFFLSFIVVFINTTMIYSTIYYRERYGPSHSRVRMQQPPHLQTHTELPSSYGSSTVISNISSQNNKESTIYENNDRSIIEPNDEIDENPNTSENRNIDQSEPQTQETEINNDSVDIESECIDVPSSRTVTESNSSNTRTGERDSSNYDSTASTIPTATPAQRRHQLRQQQQQQLTAGAVQVQRQQQQLRTSVRTSRIAAIQCVLYVSTALFTTVWSVMPWIGKKLMVTSKWRFFFAFMFNIFNPMQGFLTLIIFIRLQYLRLRVSEPNWSRLQCIRFCLFSPDAK